MQVTGDGIFALTMIVIACIQMFGSFQELAKLVEGILDGVVSTEVVAF